MKFCLDAILYIVLCIPTPMGVHSMANSAMTLPAQGWWDAPIIDNWGQYPDPQGPFPKPDLNILTPANYPFVAILPGVVSGINFAPGSSVSPDNPSVSPAFGAVITVKMDKPINQIATHYVYLHLQRIQPGITIGMHVQPGQVLGYGGGGQTLGSAPAAPGFALYAGDHYGFGPEWLNYVQRPNHTIDPRLDPRPLYNSLKTGNIGLDFAQNFSTFPTSLDSAPSQSSNTGLLNKVTVAFKPNESVAQFFTGIDEILQVINPVPQSDDVDQINILGSSFPNPISWTSDLLFNFFVVDLPAVIIRSIIIIVGTFICYKVISTSIGLNISRSLQGGTGSSI